MNSPLDGEAPFIFRALPVSSWRRLHAGAMRTQRAPLVPRLACAAIVLLAHTVAAEDAEPRYLLMNMQYGNIPYFKPALAAAAPGPPAANPALAVGISTLFNLVNNDTNTGGPLLPGIEELLANVTRERTPIFLGIDGENWWSNSGLANWWDPESPGYNPANRFNVEWTSPDGATDDSSVLKISWRNWGSQIRVSPQQNFHSPPVMAAYKQQLRTVIPVVVRCTTRYRPAISTCWRVSRSAGKHQSAGTRTITQVETRS